MADRVAVVTLRGELDLAGAAALEQELARLDAAEPDAIVLDLRDVDFMDSSGLRVVAVAARARRSAAAGWRSCPAATR